MGSIPFAFSVHHFINSVGSDAGFASIIGLAVLVLLYFAHARETASLREQVYEWAQRAQHLEARVSQLSRQLASLPAPGAPAEPYASPAGSRPASNTVVPARATDRVYALAGAPAGVAAPALTAATKLIPTNPVVMEPVASAPVPAPELPIDATAVGSLPPATVAGGANGSARDHLQTQPIAAPPAASAPPPRIHIRQGATAPGRRPGVPPRGQPQRRERSRGRRGIVIALMAVVAVGVAAGVLILRQNGAKPKVANTGGRSSSTASTTRHPGKPAPVEPANVTVAVLNGTATTGLAGRVSLKLSGVGYKQGKVATAADQTRTSTVVGYMPGHKREALAVASVLKLGPASVQGVDSSTQSLACAGTTPCTADVVVTLGTDLANTQ